ncbi:MAG: hypothetical protein BGO49_28725 [Planctomycetales bacterium 71-10]|nr:MAG: hypothetical protein BGO49_28725 [Planctomycetales bacterium 71-10]
MPPRLVSLAILVYWSVAAFFLLTWEVLPEMTLGYPPDLRAIASAAGTNPGPVTWSIDVIDDRGKPDVRRTVGSATTESRRTEEGAYEMTSHVDVDASELLRRTPLAGAPGVHLTIDGRYDVSPRGDLRSFDMEVKGAGLGDKLFSVEGRVADGVLEVSSRGIASLLNRRMKFPYEPKGVVYDSLRPLDRLPGLQVGQRWDVQVVNPLSGTVETARVVVEKRTLIDWNGEAVSAFEVVQTAGPIRARTWVALDGVILRQQVPMPVVEMILERLPDGAPKPVAEPARGDER